MKETKNKIICKILKNILTIIIIIALGIFSIWLGFKMGPNKTYYIEYYNCRCNHIIKTTYDKTNENTDNEEEVYEEEPDEKEPYHVEEYIEPMTREVPEGSELNYVFLTPEDKKYHKPSCRFISNRVLICYMSEEEAKKQGYTPCENCYCE